MITSIALYEGVSNDPHYNLAVEQHLLETVKEGQCILYLWQNQNTVVIGRNQNPWKECRTTLLEEEGGRLARRLSGGGAVFHDLGNLNFTFLMPQADYDLERQLSVIQEAVRELGIPAEKSGRNDILACGRKFSGNAFYKNGKQAYHHGTLLVDADMEKLSRYLNPSKAKLQAKGVDSVRSRVGNLKELNPQITVEALKTALTNTFSRLYGGNLEIIRHADLQQSHIAELTERNRSWEWNYGQKLPFTWECEDRFLWGGVQIRLQIEGGVIRQAKVYSDAMDCFLMPQWEEKLTGCRFEKQALEQVLSRQDRAEEQDVCQMLTQNML
jgi:lipoate-protein ligase A